jgi:hypothetical protein
MEGEEVMSDKSRVPHPKNAPGPFYVENDCCICCEAPYAEAPDLMAWDEEDNGYHCRFRKQPKTPDEVERAIRACVVSCVNAVRYAGNDPAILERFREWRSTISCDEIEDTKPEEIADRPRAFFWESPMNPSLPSPDPSHPLWDSDLDGR